VQCFASSDSFQMPNPADR